MGRLDKTLARAGIVRAEEKDVTAELSDTRVTCIGVDVCQGIFLSPHNQKLCKIIAGVLGFFMRPQREVTLDGLAAPSWALLLVCAAEQTALLLLRYGLRFHSARRTRCHKGTP